MCLLQLRKERAIGRVVFYVTVSPDGFIAGPNTEIDRLFDWYFIGDTEIPTP